MAEENNVANHRQPNAAGTSGAAFGCPSA